MPYTELYHWGIPGQRWGIRKYQNEDGSLTPAGELRYNQGKQKVARGKAAEMYKTKKFKDRLKLKEEKRKIKAAAEAAKTVHKEQSKVNKTIARLGEKKKAEDMTDEELNHEINRLTNEIDYNIKKYKASKGVTLFDKINAAADTTVGRAVMNTGLDIVKNAANRAVNDMVDSKFDLEKVARIKQIDTETSNKVRIANASIEKTRAEAKKHLSEGEKHLAEARKHDQEALNSKNESEAKVRNDNETHAESLRSSKALNDEEIARSHQLTLSTKKIEQLNRKSAENEHVLKYGKDVTSKQWQDRLDIIDAKNRADLIKEQTRAKEAAVPKLSKQQLATAEWQREQARKDSSHASKLNRAEEKQRREQDRLDSESARQQTRLDKASQARQKRLNSAQKHYQKTVSAGRAGASIFGKQSAKYIIKKEPTIKSGETKTQSILITDPTQVNDILKNFESSPDVRKYIYMK